MTHGNEICPKCNGAGTLPKICKLCKWYRRESKSIHITNYEAHICDAPIPIVVDDCKYHYTEPYRDAEKCPCWDLGNK